MSDLEELIDADGLLQELDALRERRDEAIDALANDLNNVGDQVNDIASDVEVQLAEAEVGLVDQSIQLAISVIRGTDTESLEEVARLGSITLPGDPEPSSSNQREKSKKPRLTQVDLPGPQPVAEQKRMPREKVAEILSEHVSTCAARIRHLLDYFADEFWPYTVNKAEDGEFDQDSLTAELDAIADDLSKAVRAWRGWIQALYDLSPSHLGVVSSTVPAVALTEDTAS